MSILKNMKYKNKSGTLISLKVDASNVNEDAQHRFVSDTEKNTYDGKVTALGGDLSNTKINNFDSVTTEFPIPEPGETTKTILGKMRKFLQDFNTFKTNIITLSKLANNLTTTSVGMALDARQGKVLKDEINTLNGSLQAVNNKINNNIYAIKQNLPGATLQPYKSYSTVATVQDINGYTPIFAIPANSGNADLAWTRCEITSGYSLNIGLFNVHENAQTTSRITVIIAYKISE